jgi:hypothetical protein
MKRNVVANQCVLKLRHYAALKDYHRDDIAASCEERNSI